ncbi:DHHA2 domain [Musa troglodytarum]|uniref:DHHA2 domain n=1 Tax=Musa troglodytarum TaxID=320322 RepID=A0A9E7K613_9LILI|nr:DHHA2 domain [Musa troglodytarum]
MRKKHKNKGYARSEQSKAAGGHHDNKNTFCPFLYPLPPVTVICSSACIFMVFIGLIQDEMRNLKLLSAGKHKVRVSTQTKIYVSQDTTSTSLSHSLREMDCKQRPPGTTNTSKPVPASSDVEQELTRASGDAERNGSRPSTASSAQSAAAFFENISLRNDSSILEACESIDRLNQYLNHRKADVRAGVPGQFLHAVIGQAVADVGSVVSTIACAFFLNQTQTSSHHCVLPVINTKRADFVAHSELKWLLNSCRVDESSIVFVDEIDLSYHNRFGNLKLVLVNDHKLPPNKEGLKDVPIEMFNCKEVCSETASLQDVTMSQDGSCCTLIAEKYAETSPEILAGQGFCRLLLSGILLDTKNLTGANCTAKDKYMATLLIKGAGRFGCSGFYQLLKYKISDISDLLVRDILRRDFKKWSTYSGKHSIPNTGMSSIGISIEELLKHEDSAAKEVIRFQGNRILSAC